MRAALNALLAMGLLAAATGQAAGRPAAVRLSPVAAVAMTEAPRFGLNLGGASTWGAEQLMANVLKNPGFEATVERSLVVAGKIAGGTVTDDTPWTARPDGLWNDADFEVLSGRAAGARGKVIAYRRDGSGGPGTFALAPLPPGLRAADAFAVTRMSAAAGVPLWWTTGDVRVAPGEARPGAGGLQAARLAARDGQPGRLAHHLDRLKRAGRLLPVEGAWRLEFWARTDTPGTRLAVAFRRHGNAAFLAREVVLARGWQHFSLPMQAADAGPHGALELSFEVRSGDALLDDAYLGEALAGPGGFRLAAVEALRGLRPGYLRDWQGQLADTVENRLADASARRPTRHRPGDAEIAYHYGLHEFLALCAAIGARPWVVAPPLMGEDEWRRLGEALAAAARRHGFDEMVVEFGNENWNAIFRPAGFLSATAHAAAADRAFAGLKAGAGDFRGIVAAVNAQYVNPASWKTLAALSRQAERIAVAPYFLYRLDEVGEQAAVQAAFADTLAPLREGGAGVLANGKRLSVYEVNFHTTHGTASSDLRDLAVAGAHGGAALARQLLGSLLAGAREQAVYTFAGFDAFTADRQLVRLWGVTRDLAPGRLRPTGLALKMLNGAVHGNAHASACEGDATACADLTAVWFRRGDGLALAVASRHPGSLRVRTGIACATAVVIEILDGHDATRNNETTEAVRIGKAAASCEAGWVFDLPARSLAVLRAPGAVARGEAR